MDEELFENFAASFGIYRKRYGNLRIPSDDRAVVLSSDDSIIFTKDLLHFCIT